MKNNQEKHYELFLDFGDNIGTQTIYSSARLEDCERRKSKMTNNLDKYYTKEWQGLPKDVVAINIDSWTMTLDNREVTKLKLQL
jgi:hypothetical protein